MSARFEDIAERWLEPQFRGSNEFMCRCPFCGGGTSLQFNIDTGAWLCFRCDSKGNAKSLVKKLGGSYADPVVSTEHIRNRMDRIRISNKKRDRVEAVLPESVLARYRFADDYWTSVRGFSQQTVDEWSLGYDPISDRHIIPYRNPDGDLLGVIQRLKGNVFPRYIYPDNFERKGSLFGSWRVKGRKCGIVEGSTDVLSLYEADRVSVAQYGSSISRLQIKLLHLLGIDEVVLFYDYDEAGRKAEEKSRQYLDGILLRSVTYDPDEFCWHKKLCGCGYHTWRSIGQCEKKKLCKCGRKHEADPGSLDFEVIQEMYDAARLVGKKTWKP